MLRELRPADAARCADLEKLLFPGETPWTKQVFLADFPRAHTFYFGVERLGKLVGYAGIARLGPATEPEYEILTIGVDPQLHRQGVGKLMMDNICHIADTDNAPVFLEVRVGNSPAVSLYESYGFVHLGIRRNYYQPSGADAHTMVRPRRTERKPQ